MDTGVIDKVRKLLRLAESANANESALAAAKAQELIDRHQLTQAMLELESAAPIADEPIQRYSDAPLDSPRQLDRWRSSLAVTIGRHNAVSIYCVGPRLMLVGRPSDAETVRYLYGWLSRDVERLAAAAGAGKGRTWRNNFRLGVVDTIAAKLRAQRADFEQAAKTEAGSGMALVRVNQGLARVAERREATTAWVKANMKLRSRSASRTTFDYSAREAGRRAGASIDIGARRGLGAGPVRRIGGA